MITLESRRPETVEEEVFASPLSCTFSDTLVTVQVHTPDPSEAHKNQYVAFANNPINFRDPFGLYQYDTSNLGLAFLHEVNPFNTHGAFSGQAVSIGNAMGGGLAWAAGYSSGAQQVLQQAVQGSGYAMLEDECAGKGWKGAYWGSLGVSGAAISVPAGQMLLQGGGALWRGGADVSYRVMATRPMALLDAMILYAPFSPPARATVGELVTTYGPPTAQFISGFVTTGPVNRPAEALGFGADLIVDMLRGE